MELNALVRAVAGQSPIDEAAVRQLALTKRALERGPVVNKPLRPRLPPVATGPFKDARGSGDPR